MKIELPPKYYLAHFLELRSVLLNQYGDFFQEIHFAFLNDFDQLSEDAQCLYLRLMNRKGKFFFKESLKYNEINHLDEKFVELKANRFIKEITGHDWQDLIPFLPKPKLIELATEKSLAFKKSWSKEKLQETLLQIEFYPTDHLAGIIVQDRMEELSYLIFLYFGKIQDNLSLYTLRDLGVRKVSKEKSTFKARFQSKDEALSHYFFAKLAEDYSDYGEITHWPGPLNQESVHLRESILLSIAEDFKKENDLIKALEVYRLCTQHPGREKRIRLLYQLEMKEECLAELNLVLDNPLSDLEYLFAEDYLARKFQKKKLGVLTETLRNSRKISIDESYFRHPEMGVEDYFREQGLLSFHLENYLWNSLFGLLFWEELFESDKTALFNEFERSPKDLWSDKFYILHEADIHQKLTLFKDQELILAHLIKKIETKNGIQNGIFGWHESIASNLITFISHATPESICDILIHMAKDYHKRSTGFPDLLAIENGKAKFYEIKAEGDSLKQTQLLQMIALKRAGFEVEILQVEYAFNPEQTYVVVDIETTGGGSPYHRITELGAVKIRNGIIIDKYQQLVNPQKFISREIEALTGISNEMVRSAPKFMEVADAFDEFTKDAIFVAHNVSFDYGFIQAEFLRLERRFVRPYICTKVGMRKHYPGLQSYGLKNLCLNFEINLVNHHRALADAEAAAALLVLINNKRALEKA